MKENKPNKIIVHHSASSIKTTLAQINKWHKDRGFYYNEAFDNYIGYHFLIFPNGNIEQTKLLKDEGCHTIGQNTSSIGICVIGNFENDYVSDKQAQSIMTLIDYLNKTTGKTLPIYKHKDFSNTLCPGKNLSFIVDILNNPDIMKLIYK